MGEMGEWGERWRRQIKEGEREDGEKESMDER